MFKPLIAAGATGLVLAGLAGCATRAAAPDANLATLLVRQDTLAENEQANLVYRRNDWRDYPGDPVTYIYEGAQPVLAGEPAFIEVEMVRIGRPRVYCGRRFSFVPIRGRAYQVTPTFEGEGCSVRLADVRTGRQPGSYQPLADIVVGPMPELPPPTSIDWLD